jgi:hypothetical protein
MTLSRRKRRGIIGFLRPESRSYVYSAASAARMKARQAHEIRPKENKIGSKYNIYASIICDLIELKQSGFVPDDIIGTEGAFIAS